MLRRHKEKHWPMLRKCWVLPGSVGETLLDFRQGKTQGCWEKKCKFGLSLGEESVGKTLGQCQGDDASGHLAMLRKLKRH
jgi:hypothetical protein